MQRESFFRVGGFRHMPIMEDVELCERLRAISPPICVHSRVTVPGECYDRDGIWRTLRAMTAMRWRYRMGAQPEALAKRYGLEGGAASPSVRSRAGGNPAEPALGPRFRGDERSKR